MGIWEYVYTFSLTEFQNLEQSLTKAKLKNLTKGDPSKMKQYNDLNSMIKKYGSKFKI